MFGFIWSRSCLKKYLAWVYTVEPIVLSRYYIISCVLSFSIILKVAVVFLSNLFYINFKTAKIFLMSLCHMTMNRLSSYWAFSLKSTELSESFSLLLVLQPGTSLFSVHFSHCWLLLSAKNIRIINYKQVHILNNGRTFSKGPK